MFKKRTGWLPWNADHLIHMSFARSTLSQSETQDILYLCVISKSCNPAGRSRGCSWGDKSRQENCGKHMTVCAGSPDGSPNVRRCPPVSAGDTSWLACPRLSCPRPITF